MLYKKNSLLPLTIAVSLALTACNQETSSQAGPDYNSPKDTDTNFDQLGLINNLADNIITPTFEQLQNQTNEQVSAVSNYCNAEQALISTNESKALAQSTWRNTMATWQQAELMLLGPLQKNLGSVSYKIYSWPVVNSCNVDFDVMYFKEGIVNGQPYDITKRTSQRTGFDALEYLLFNENLAHSCESSEPQGWDVLTDTEKKIARCQFAEEVATDIKNNTDTLLALWSGENGYANKLKAAGSTGSIFPSEHDAVNDISDALFYIDSTTKDEKLAKPLGLFENSCGTSECPEDVESPYSNNSYDNIYYNLVGFEKLFSGVDGLGFDDYLTDVGDEATAKSMTENTNTALNDISDIDVSLADALATDPDVVTQSHSNVKNITDQLKTDFINSLALELPSTSAGDND